MKPNPGHQPKETIGKRVLVRLRDGHESRSPGWAADGRGGCRWTLTNSPYDIVEYEVTR